MKSEYQIQCEIEPRLNYHPGSPAVVTLDGCQVGTVSWVGWYGRDSWRVDVSACPFSPHLVEGGLPDVRLFMAKRLARIRYEADVKADAAQWLRENVDHLVLLAQEVRESVDRGDWDECKSAMGSVHDHLELMQDQASGLQ